MGSFGPVDDMRIREIVIEAVPAAGVISVAHAGGGF